MNEALQIAAFVARVGLLLVGFYVVHTHPRLDRYDKSLAYVGLSILWATGL